MNFVYILDVKDLLGLGFIFTLLALYAWIALGDYLQRRKRK
jgi:hypothetical protein